MTTSAGGPSTLSLLLFLAGVAALLSGALLVAACWLTDAITRHRERCVARNARLAAIHHAQDLEEELQEILLEERDRAAAADWGLDAP